MTVKKLYTREEFEQLRLEKAGEMAADKVLIEEARQIMAKADRYYWLHQMNWFGEPVLNLPQDMFAFAEIIYRTRPEFIIELGVAWGGSLLFYSTLLQILGGKNVIGVDVYIPDDLKTRLASHGKISKKIILINGSSTNEGTVAKIKSILEGSRKILIILDSLHTHKHVLKELKIYSQFVGKDYYLICGDTDIEYIPQPEDRPRPWGVGNNPKTALDEFLKENDRFVIDQSVDNKLLFTCIPGGYLKCIKN